MKPRDVERWVDYALLAAVLALLAIGAWEMFRSAPAHAGSGGLERGRACGELLRGVGQSMLERRAGGMSELEMRGKLQEHPRAAWYANLMTLWMRRLYGVAESQEQWRAYAFDVCRRMREDGTLEPDGAQAPAPLHQAAPMLEPQCEAKVIAPYVATLTEQEHHEAVATMVAMGGIEPAHAARYHLLIAEAHRTNDLEAWVRARCAQSGT